MSDIPLLYQPPMVQALMDRRKKQTRRLVKRLRHFGQITEFGRSDTKGYDWHFRDKAMRWHDISNERLLELAPYRAGQLMWGRETWARTRLAQAGGAEVFVYLTADNRTDYGGPWRPSIFMPREACRIERALVEVRLERLQDISEADADAEGCERLFEDEPGYVDRDEPDWKLCPRCGGTRLYDGIGASMGVLPDQDCHDCDTYTKRYRWLWESINGPDSWAKNPWVWVLRWE